MKFLILLLLSIPYSFAATWVTNKDHSEILFQVPYMGVSDVTGRFNEFDGEVVFRPGMKAIDSLTVEIAAASIDTGNKMRDGHLRGSDFFKSQEFQFITFKSNKVKTLKDKSFEAEGTLTVKGISKPSVIQFSTTDSLKDTWGYENKFVKFKSTLNRKDFNINWNKTLDGKEFLVGDTIAFWGTFQVQPSNGKTPNSKHMIPDTTYIRERDLQRRTEDESWLSKKVRALINGK